jgi:hypothetical protein
VIPRCFDLNIIGPIIRGIKVGFVGSLKPKDLKAVKA